MENELKINVILGGFALFLWGIKQLGDGFREAAGPKIRDYIAKYTGSLMSSIIVGTIIILSPFIGGIIAITGILDVPLDFRKFRKTV